MSSTSNPFELNNANLSAIAELNQSKLTVPHYDRSQLQVGIVHLGFGNFHRAHLARYTHELMALDFERHASWGILGVGLLPADAGMYDALSPQDALYTLVSRDGASPERAEIVGSVHSLHHAAKSDDAVLSLLALLASPQVRIVSLTVTENGYCLHPVTKRLDPLRVAQDVARPHCPRTAVGLIAQALRLRRDAGLPPFTALSCDNIQHNGGVLRQAVLDYAALVDAPLAQWIAEHARFPSTMVDRITPVTTDGDRAHVAAAYGVLDRWPVCCEAFTQFVVEDSFAAGRPAWERVGVQFVEDVAPYEKMKLRLLNASHLAVATLGDLAGLQRIDEAMATPLLARYMRALMARETGRTLPALPGVDLGEYQRTLLQRFANTAIRDTVQRVATDAPLSTVLDSMRDLAKDGGQLQLCALCLAAWLRRVRGGKNDAGGEIVVRHPMAEELRALAEQGGKDPMPLLGVTTLFGELKENAEVVGLVGRYLGMLYDHGSLKTLELLSEELSF